MATISFKRLTAVPSSPANDTMYFITQGSNHFEVYIKGNAASSMRRILTSSDVNGLIDAKVAGLSALKVVATIAARNALTITSNALVLVKDASADTSVSSGAALYVGEPDDGDADALPQWTKVAEFESMDVTLSWANIQGKPASTAANIDDAVAKKHVHTNATQLNKIGQDASGNLTYDSALPKIGWDEAAW